MGVVTYIMHGQCGGAVVDRAENRAPAYSALSRLHLDTGGGLLAQLHREGLVRGGEVIFGRGQQWHAGRATSTASEDARRVGFNAGWT